MKKYVLNPRIVADKFDDDFILANLDTGIYYSLNGIAVFLISKLPFTDINPRINEIADFFSEQKAEVENDLKAIWSLLTKEEIVLFVGMDKKVESNFEMEQPDVFVPSKLAKYADMQDLLMMDPIHEVDEDGWALEDIDNEEPKE